MKQKVIFLLDFLIFPSNSTFYGVESEMMDSDCRQSLLLDDHFATDLSTCIDYTPHEKQNSSCYRSGTSNLPIFWLFYFSSFNLVIYFIKIISNLASPQNPKQIPFILIISIHKNISFYCRYQ